MVIRMNMHVMYNGVALCTLFKFVLSFPVVDAC